jgi:hypothetical protein
MENHNYSNEKPEYTPNPDGPLPGPFPGPLPGPLPDPFPGPFPGPLPGPLPWPPDWWRCLRWTPISGRYEGDMTAPKPGRSALDMRIDIDPRYANSPVMNKVSGDFYTVYNFSWPGGRRFNWRVYRESWIIDAPNVRWSRCQVEITGSVRFWKGIHPVTDATITIPWSNGILGNAIVNFVETAGSSYAYSCNRTSDCFRNMTLEIDVCQSVNVAPLLPSYDTHWHNTRPSDLPQRTLTIEDAYREAGVCVTLNPTNTVINDSAPGFATWSPAELHDAMETNFSQITSGWPKWHMWGLLAGTFDNSGVGGIMFDAAAAFGGAGEPPERQGFAVFRNHTWFNNLVAGAPATQDQAWAMRHFLYTYVHEAGHAFNFLHSWNKSRPDSLSWMNYDWRYDSLPGNNSGDFWSKFRMRFDDDELIHMRHGDRASVIMGGDPWASGGHLESPAGAMQMSDGQAPVELLLRSKEYFEFMEPVSIELRLRNTLEDIPLELDTQLSPEFGSTIIYIQRPGGQILEYAPIFCKLATPQLQMLQPTNTKTEGADRYSQNIFLSYGSYGFYFAEPGDYRVRVVYQGAGDMLITSNTLSVRIGRPFSKEEDRLAQDYFTYPVGMALYLDGSQSPFLESGMNVLQTVADQFKDTAVGAKAAITVANSVGHSFYRVQEKAKKSALVQTHKADPRQALKLTAPALAFYNRQKTKAFNLPHHELVRSRAELLVQTGDNAKARQELAALRKELKARAVNESVLNAIEAYEKKIK